MDIDEFSPTIDRTVILETASEVARFSFIVQSSVSYLDLKGCENSADFLWSPSASFVNTEEKCRLFFAPLRSLLYTLHLDLPKGGECSLKEGLPDSGLTMQSRGSPNIAGIAVDNRFYDYVISNFVDEALSRNIPKEKLLKWILQTSVREKLLLSRLDIQTANQFIACVYPEVKDSALFNDFIEHFDIMKWLDFYEEPEVLEFLLYNARLRGNVSLKEECDSELISNCMFWGKYLNIRPILNYLSDSAPTYIDYEDQLHDLSLARPGLFEDVTENAAKSTTWERISRMAQILLVFMDLTRRRLCNHQAAKEALRLIWSSIPEPCVTLEELHDAFGALFDEEELTSIHDFYVEAIGEFHERVEARSLQHLSRTVLRRTFQKNNAWIPDAIRRTGLPKLLQAFLNLEKPFGV